MYILKNCFLKFAIKLTVHNHHYKSQFYPIHIDVAYFHKINLNLIILALSVELISLQQDLPFCIPCIPPFMLHI